MNRFFGPAVLGGWLTGLLPDGVFNLGRKTPWYRKSWMTNAPWIGAALMAPLAVFLAWKGGTILLAKQEKS